MMKKVSFYLLGYLFTLMMLSSCNYDYINPEPVVIPKDSIKFSTQIEPIFNVGNNCTSCHSTGGQIPNLTTGNAYNSINNATFINLTTPETSLIYVHPLAATAAHAWKKYSAEQSVYILKWIQEGAKNN
jgi:hypothetical protein